MIIYLKAMMARLARLSARCLRSSSLPKVWVFVGSIGSYSRWDCPFHPANLAGSSLLLSDSVNSKSASAKRKTSAYASELTLRPLLCAVWTFLSAQRGVIIRLPKRLYFNTNWF